MVHVREGEPDEGHVIETLFKIHVIIYDFLFSVVDMCQHNTDTEPMWGQFIDCLAQSPLVVFVVNDE